LIDRKTKTVRLIIFFMID